MVFVRTKHGADRVAQDLNRAGIRAAAIHGDKSQGQRQAALSRLKEGSMRVLVATDIAARGIDIEDLSHVINFDLPNVPETYVHRIGRTGRAGMSGRAVSFCDFEEKVYLADIEKLIKKKITVVQQHPYPMEVFEPTAKPARVPTVLLRENGRNGDVFQRLDSRRRQRYLFVWRSRSLLPIKRGFSSRKNVSTKQILVRCQEKSS